MLQQHEKLDVLFISEQAPWPLDQGFKVHGYHMAASMSAQGVRVKFASLEPPPAEAPQALHDVSVAWPAPDAMHIQQFEQALDSPSGGPMGRRLDRARRRLTRYLTDGAPRLAGALALVDRYRPEAVVGVGIHVPIVLRALRQARGVRCVWYGADELINFHLSCMRRDRLGALPGRLRQLALHAALELLFVRGLDGAIGVSPTDTRLLRWLAGARWAVTIRNGVDLDRFAPQALNHVTRQPVSLAFWGRMDFAPNVDAVRWFARRVWPQLKRRHPEAVWRIAGGGAPRSVQALGALDGIELLGRVPDVRAVAQGAAATILPMRCGGGIKNKLLEAAAMACPIIASPVAVRGLELDGYRPAVLVRRTPAQWLEAIEQVWSQPALASNLGRNARAWVSQRHNWSTAARALAGWLASVPRPVVKAPSAAGVPVPPAVTREAA